MPDPRSEEFFVGYLPASARTVRLARMIAIILCIAAVIVGVAIVTLRRNPGHGTWDDATRRTFTGTITASPFPALHLTEPAGDLPIGTALLLVEEGKFGASRAVLFDGKRSRVQGFLLQRDRLAMIELAPDPDALVRITDTLPAPAPTFSEASSTIELTGEIVDIKCFLGAMKPGDGIVHRPCAIRCVDGGIPPVLISQDEQGRITTAVVTNADGSPLTPDQQRFVGLPVRLRGTLTTVGGLRTLRLAAIEYTDRLARNHTGSKTSSFCGAIGTGDSSPVAPSNHRHMPSLAAHTLLTSGSH